MNLAFRTLGGSGEDAVLIHGFGSDRLSWLGTSPALVPLARVHSLDLPGHGESPTDAGDGSPAALARRVQETLEANGLQRAHLVGHSLGGGIALLLASHSPERVASLSLIAPVGLGLGIDRDFLGAYSDLADSDTATKLLQRLVVKPQIIGKQTVERVLQQLARHGVRDALRAIASALASSAPELEAAARTVRERSIPRLTLWGEQDAINPVSPERLEAFGGEQFMVAGAAHLPHIEAIPAVNARLAAFLSSRIGR